MRSLDTVLVVNPLLMICSPTLWRSKRLWSRSYSGTQLFDDQIERLKQGAARADSNTYGLLIRHCCSEKDLECGRWLHSHLHRHGYGADTFLANLLVKMYSACGCIEEAQAVFLGIRSKNVYSWNIIISAYSQNGNLLQARKLFDQMPHKDAVSWTTMITCYAQDGGHHREALHLFKLMDLSGVHPDRVTFISVLNACTSLGKIAEAQAILELVTEKESSLDVVLGTSMVAIYGRCGRVHQARRVFESMAERNIVSWTVLLEAIAENGNLVEARSLLEKMCEWCTSAWVVMITAYTRCGGLPEAEKLLEEMMFRSVAAWTVVISANAHAGNMSKASRLFQLMDLDGVFPDKITLVNVLDGCSKFQALAEGRIIESAITDTGFVADEKIVTNLINLHGKCGSLEQARCLFEDVMVQESVILWTSMMTAYAQNGHGDEAMELYWCMKLHGMKPTAITLTIVLFVCSHGGELKKGWEHFVEMQEDHGLIPDSDHFVTMIDLLGRSAQIRQAFELIECMPFVPDDVAWTILLGACKLYGEPEWGARAAKQLVKLNGGDSAPYVLLATVFKDQRNTGG